MTACPFQTHLLCSTDEMLLECDRHEMYRFAQEVCREVKVGSYIRGTEEDKAAFRQCILKKLGETQDPVRVQVVLQALRHKEYRQRVCV